MNLCNIWIHKWGEWKFVGIDHKWIIYERHCKLCSKSQTKYVDMSEQPPIAMQEDVSNFILSSQIQMIVWTT